MIAAIYQHVSPILADTIKKLIPQSNPQPIKKVPDTWYGRIQYNISPYLKPKYFFLSSMILTCVLSLALNIHLMKQHRDFLDNDIKYRYLMMKGEASGETLSKLEYSFRWQRDNSFIQSLKDSVLDFEYRTMKQAEVLERVRLLNEQAQQLKEEAEKLRK